MDMSFVYIDCLYNYYYILYIINDNKYVCLICPNNYKVLIISIIKQDIFSKFFMSWDSPYNHCTVNQSEKVISK